MSDGQVALGMDRLPWLPDEPVRPKPARAGGGGADLLAWVFAALLLVAGAAYWLGTRSAEQTREVASSTPPVATAPLPRPAPAETEVQPVAQPEVRRIPEPEVQRVTERAAAPARPAWRPLPRAVPKEVAERVERTMATAESDKVSKAQTGAVVKPPPRPPVIVPVNTQNVKLWPARESGGAYGRVVQIGAFGSRLQAKLGWKHMARAYPGVQRLPAVVVEARNSRGRPFYRFQIGTTSQAHSEVLCQRMEKIRFSCAVVGLPGAKRTIER